MWKYSLSATLGLRKSERSIIKKQILVTHQCTKHAYAEQLHCRRIEDGSSGARTFESFYFFVSKIKINQEKNANYC